MKKVWVGGIEITALTCQEWVDLFFEDKKNRVRPKFFTSANGNVVSQYATNSRLRQIIEKADGVDADGMSLVIASRLLSDTALPERVVTTDFFHLLVRDSRSVGLKVFFLGGTDHDNSVAVSNCKREYPSVIFDGHHGYFDEPSNVIELVNNYKPDILFVGMGVPKEHLFCDANLDKFSSAVWVKTCGGMFRVLAGQVQRPPEWMRKFCLEWFYRCIKEPKHVLARYMKTCPHSIYLFLKNRKNRNEIK